jgi:CRISPR-associated protein Cmr6
VTRHQGQETWSIREAHLPFEEHHLCQAGWGALQRGDVVNNLDVEYDLERGQIRRGSVRRYAAVPEGVRRLLNQHGCDHPGLVLDRFIYRCNDQSTVRGALEQVLGIQSAFVQEYPRFLDRRQQMLISLGAEGFLARTNGPLTLHLARASALENAGICLHPLYGFMYLPASGLKGMARAFAQTVWLPTQPHQEAAEQTLKQVFGRIDGEAAAGAIIFHDAWPETWPKLQLDIVNNHHRKYYEERADSPPGDWETPTMVSFLAVAPETSFRFALSLRRDEKRELRDLARSWLIGALTHLGAGAKTAAGYGSFQIVDETAPPRELAQPAEQMWQQACKIPEPARLEHEETLKLVSPAFLAGARQQAEDCDLRPATLRGLLRWWWRTMHVGFVTAEQLRWLEAAVWGDTRQGGALRLCVERQAQPRAKQYDLRDRQDRFRVARAFQNEHQLCDPPQRTTQGLFYATYGMDDGGRQRHFLDPGTSWKVRLTARKGRYSEWNERGKEVRGQPLCARDILEQGKAALWLLCHLGGVGSRSRKGFGSLADLQGLSLDQCKKLGQDFRQVCGLTGSFRKQLAASASLEQILSPPADGRPWLEVLTPWHDHWFALDQVGFSAQRFAQDHSHQCEKVALGLPRQIHGPRRTPMPHQQGSHQPPERLRAPRGDRHASPVHYHLASSPDGILIIRVTAFLAPELPDEPTSRCMLQELLKHLQNDLQQRAREHCNVGAPPPASASPPGGGRSRRPEGTPVIVRILEVRDAERNRFRVQEAEKPPGILDVGVPHNPLPNIGDSINVFISSDDPRCPKYRWDQPPPPAPQGRGGPRGRQPPPRGGRR